MISVSIEEEWEETNGKGDGGKEGINSCKVFSKDLLNRIIQIFKVLCSALTVLWLYCTLNKVLLHVVDGKYQFYYVLTATC